MRCTWMVSMGCHRKLTFLLLVGAFFWTSCASLSHDEAFIETLIEKPSSSRYEATIRRTSYGVPHITAQDWGSLGFGQGYAFAQDRVCLLADQIIKVRSERAFYFGAGENNRNLESDFAYQALEVIPKAQAALDRLSPEVRQMLEGYVAGYNLYLSQTPATNLPPACQSQAWVKPIQPADLLAYYLDVVTLAGSRNFLDFIAGAAPPGSEVKASQRVLPVGKTYGLASNGVALGKEKTLSKRGMVLSNTHLPWEGELKYHEVHLTIPGVLDVAGVSLSGAIGVLIGFNEALAWTHTTSTSNQFTVYQLKLVPGNLLAYQYDDQTRLITSRKVAIQVKQADGSLQTQERTLYRSHYGPMIAAPGLGVVWDSTSAYAIKDANADNFNFLASFLNMARAKTLDDFKKTFRTVGGIPWNNTMMADREGHVFYADTTLVPKLKPEAMTAFQEKLANDPRTQLFYSASVVLLDGSTSAFEWQNDAEATLPGVIPFREAPQLERSDYVANMNDSYWLSNPAQPLEGFALFYGSERTPRSPRTRMGLRLIAEEAGTDGRFTLEELQAMLMKNRSLTADLFLSDLLQRCQGITNVILTSGEVIDIREACQALAQWNGRLDLDTPGIVVFREWMGSFDKATITNGDLLYSVKFDPNDPVQTPKTLKPIANDGNTDPLLQRLGLAAKRLQEAKIPFNATLRDVQFVRKGTEKIPMHGGLQTQEGAFHKMNYSNDSALITTLLPRPLQQSVINAETGLTAEGYYVNYGASFVMAVEFNEEGPQAKAILAYSQSEDPRSPHFSDQTRLFAAKGWRSVLYREKDILADPNLTTLSLSLP